MKSFFSGSALLVSATLFSFLLFSAPPSLAQTLLSKFQKQASRQTVQEPAATAAPADAAAPDVKLSTDKVVPTTENASAINPIAPKSSSEKGGDEGVHYIATAYSLRGKTASGRYVSKGIIAADPRVLPLGSRVRLEAGAWSGEYLVADTGGAIRGRKIDIWTPSTREAMKFGKRKVKLTVLSYPARRTAKKRV